MPRTQSVSLPDELGVSESVLIFEGDVLLAVLALLSGSIFEDEDGRWHVEATFTPELRFGEVFDDLDAALGRFPQSARDSIPVLSAAQPIG